MREIIYALPGVGLTIMCWGVYGSVLHKGQDALGNNRLKPLICVGLAYFIVAIIIPSAILWSRGDFRGDWTISGLIWSLSAGVAGALGALGIILALSNGGRPSYVMPLVFGFAPIVNVFATMVLNKVPWKNFHPVFLAGLFMVAMGASLVLMFKPGGPPSKKTPPPVENAKAEKAITKENPEETKSDDVEA